MYIDNPVINVIIICKSEPSSSLKGAQRGKTSSRTVVGYPPNRGLWLGRHWLYAAVSCVCGSGVANTAAA